MAGMNQRPKRRARYERNKFTKGRTPNPRLAKVRRLQEQKEKKLRLLESLLKKKEHSQE